LLHDIRQRPLDGIDQQLTQFGSQRSRPYVPFRQISILRMFVEIFNLSLECSLNRNLINDILLCPIDDADVAELQVNLLV
jgi:hypothetical protein